MATSDAKGTHSTHNICKETKKTQVQFLKASLPPSNRPHEDLETLQKSKQTLQARRPLIIKAKSNNSPSVEITTKDLNIWSSNWIDYVIKKAGMKVKSRF